MPLSLISQSDPCLWTPASPVTDIQTQVLPYLDEMRQLMADHHGIGLAAPQVGISYRFFIWKYGVVINPRIIELSGYNISKSEGCLSFPGRTTFVARREHAAVEWTDDQGREMANVFSGLEARCFQHEADHLLGICLYKRAS